MSEQAGEAPRQPSADDVVEAIRALKVADLLRSTLFTLAQLGFAKLDEQARDLAQARLAIEALRALLPVAEEELGADLARDLRSTVANLQLAYATAAGAAEPEPATAAEPEPATGAEPEPEPADVEPEPEAEPEPEPEPGGESEPEGEAEPPREG